MMNDTLVEIMTKLKFLGVVLNNKLTFEGRFRIIAASGFTEKFGITRKAFFIVQGTSVGLEVPLLCSFLFMALGML